jgi:tetratricopeptide (TPR) repeat protein
MAYDNGAWNEWVPIKEAYTEARAAIDRSLKIDPNLALAHRALGWIESDFNFDFVTAQAERKRADELDPADPRVTLDAAEYAMIAGHLEEAIRLYRQIAERNPLDGSVWDALWRVLIRANRLTEAEAAARTLLELAPHSAGTHSSLALVLLYEHKPDAALAMVRQ